MTTSPNHTCEISFYSRNWMIDLGRLSRRAKKIIVRNFRPTSQSISFIKTLSNEKKLLVKSCDNDLVLERL
jgi:hypothetical protein